MVKHLFKCSACSHTWAGTPLENRSNVHTNKANESVVRCAKCGNWTGRFVSKDVPSSLLQSRSIAAKESVEARVEKTEPEKSMDDYLRLLKKSKDAEALKAGLVAMATSGGGKSLSGDDLIKILTINRLGSGDDSKAAIAELRNDFRDLKRALTNPTSPPATIPPYVELLLKKVVEGYTTPHDSGGLKFNNLEELRSAAAMFQSSGGRNILDLEFERARLEGEFRRAEANERRAWHREVLKTFEKVPQQAARILGREIVDGYERAREKRRGNPHLPIPNGFKSPEPIKISGTPVPGTDHLKIECPTCRTPIEFNQGASRVFCVNCKSTWTVVPDESRSPASGSSPSRAKEAHPGVESQALSGDYHATGSVSDKESHVVVGGGAREARSENIVLAGGTKKQKGGKK